MQIALTMSLPRRMPPSSRISVWPWTALTTSGSTRIVGGDAVQLPGAVVRHDDRGRSMINRLPRIVGGVDALRDDRSAPRVANPLEVVPRCRRRFERGADIGVTHRAVGEHDVGEVHQAAVGEEGREPSGAHEHLAEVRDRGQVHREEFLDAVARIALAHAGDRRVDGDDQRFVAGRPSRARSPSSRRRGRRRDRAETRPVRRSRLSRLPCGSRTASTACRSCPLHRRRVAACSSPRG